MSGDGALGSRPLEPPVGTDLGTAAWAEVTKHEELCGLRYEGINKEMIALRTAVDAINARFKDSVKYVLGILASLGVALILAFLNNAHTRDQADEADKREMRARLSLLTQQLAAVQPHAPLVIAPPGTQATAIQPTPVMPLNADDLNDAAGGKAK